MKYLRRLAWAEQALGQAKGMQSMTYSTGGFRRRVVRCALIAVGSAGLMSFFSSCNDFLIGVTRFADPCGTLLDCPPGSFESGRAEIGDWCVDPACVVPGACSDDQPLGTIRDICP